MEDKTRATNQEQRQQAKTSPKVEAISKEESNIVQLIVFNLRDEEFAADIDQVREIIRVGTITPIPDSPDFIKGVTNVRGEITVVIDLKARFFLPGKKEVDSKHIVISEQEKSLYGLMVDEVTEVLRIPEEKIKSTPELVTRIDRIYINGVITLENRLIILIDLAKVLEEEELAKLAEFAQKRRAAAEAREREKKVEEAPKEQITQKETTEPIEEKKAEETSKAQIAQGETKESTDEKKAKATSKTPITQKETEKSAEVKIAESRDEKKNKRSQKNEK